jgi:hypothetical protein
MSENQERFEVLPVGEMKQKYYGHGESAPLIKLDTSLVPEPLRVLIPLAEKWGISDDILRRDAVSRADKHEIESLQKTLALHDDALDAWLAGPDARNTNPSNEYLASTWRLATCGWLPTDVELLQLREEAIQ